MPLIDHPVISFVGICWMDDLLCSYKFYGFLNQKHTNTHTDTWHFVYQLAQPEESQWNCKLVKSALTGNGSSQSQSIIITRFLRLLFMQIILHCVAFSSSWLWMPPRLLSTSFTLKSLCNFSFLIYAKYSHSHTRASCGALRTIDIDMN